MSFLGQADETDVPTIAGNAPACEYGPVGTRLFIRSLNAFTLPTVTVLPDLIGEIATEVLLPVD
jgi:hypothetical protein